MDPMMDELNPYVKEPRAAAATAKELYVLALAGMLMS
jgi:hypothetical protein